MKSVSQVSLAIAVAAISAMFSCYLALRGFTSTPNQARREIVTGFRGLLIAVVDIDRVWRSNPKAKAREAELNEEKVRAKARLDELKRLSDRETAQRFQDSKTKELKSVADKYREEIIKDMKQAISSKAAEDGFDLVFDTSGKTLNGFPVLLACPGATDITDDVIGVMNRDN